MSKGFLPSRLGGAAALFAMPIVCAAVFLFAGGLRSRVLGANAQLVSVQPLPDMDGPMCEYPPASEPQLEAMAFPQNALCSQYRHGKPNRGASGHEAGAHNPRLLCRL